MEAIDASDVVLANLEPAAVSQDLAIQMGYARARGKHVILVDQQSARHAPPAAAALKPLVTLADVSFPTLAEGITYLQDRLKLV
jgi:nucleoside 2-deoxyribosyltransferase